MTSTRDIGRLPGGLPGLLAMLVLLAGGVTACGEGAADTAEAPAQSDLSALADRFWDAYLAWNPLQATYLGAHRLDDRVRDISPSGRDKPAARGPRPRGRAGRDRLLPPCPRTSD